MSKVVLEFNGNEDHVEMLTAVNAGKLQSIIWDLDQRLRQMYKYDGIETIGTEECRDLLKEIMNNNGINFEHEIFS